MGNGQCNFCNLGHKVADEAINFYQVLVHPNPNYSSKLFRFRLTYTCIVFSTLEQNAKGAFDFKPILKSATLSDCQDIPFVMMATNGSDAQGVRGFYSLAFSGNPPLHSGTLAVSPLGDLSCDVILWLQIY